MNTAFEQATADLIRAQDPTIPLHARDPVEIEGTGLMVSFVFFIPFVSPYDYLPFDKHAANVLGAEAACT